MTAIPAITIIPFITMLMSIAVLPLISKVLWHRNRNKLILSIILGIPVIIWSISSGNFSRLNHTVIFDYFPFLTLIGSLYVISGGIFTKGNIEPKPLYNTAFLAIGAVLASLVGTTGAAMLLIRPLIHTNRYRKFKIHTILFFIGITANCGGLLTPLGDPPLFMLYLRGVPFEWYIRLFPEWLFVNGMLLILYYFIDNRYWKKEPEENKIIEKKSVRPLNIKGKRNFIFLVLVMLTIALVNENIFHVMKSHVYLTLIREFILLIITYASYKLTHHLTRMENGFSWEPLKEVAYLFLGIFITMIPCLMYLEQNTSMLPVHSPASFYYLTGVLSSFLDNTPTALAFYSLAKGLFANSFSQIGGIPELYLKSIALASVFFGSMTYIGNGPNFLIKSIAESNNIKMPHFFAYILKFSLIVMLPLFILTHLIFL